MHTNYGQSSAGIIVTVLNGNSEGLVYDEPQNPVVLIGRDPGNTIILSDAGVSRHHCEIHWNGHCWQVRDLGSTNGVWVTRQATTEVISLRGQSATLQPGDELRLGEVKLRVTMHAALAVTEQFNPQPIPNRTQILPPPRVGQGSHVADPGCLETNIARLGEWAGWRLPFNFDRYTVLKKIGEGGMSEVFLAREIDSSSVDSSSNSSSNSSSDSSAYDSEVGQRWAIKFLLARLDGNAQERNRLVRELRVSAKMNHPSIVRSVKFGLDAEIPHLVMEYCSGGNLAEMLQRIGRLPLPRALRLMDRVLAGVEFAHQRGIVHRDLKPGNILLARQGPRKYFPKVSDFGLAKSYVHAGLSGMTVDGTIGGSWRYMPREQLTNFRYLSPVSDVWSLGAILYECLTLELPRLLPPEVDPVSVVMDSKIIPIDSVINDLPKAVSRFVMTALAVEPQDRFQNAAHMRAALRELAVQLKIPL